MDIFPLYILKSTFFWNIHGIFYTINNKTLLLYLLSIWGIKKTVSDTKKKNYGGHLENMFLNDMLKDIFRCLSQIPSKTALKYKNRP